MKKRLPTILMLNITEKCNSRCLTCGTWRKKSSLELDFNQFRNFCAKNKEYLKEVETVGLIGGEPFLSVNYLNFIKAVLKYCPKIRTIGQSTNSLVPDLYLRKAKEALKIIPKNVFYGISVSLDGIGSVHNEIRGVSGAFAKASRFIKEAGELFFRNDNFYLTVTTTLSKNNLTQIDKIINFTKEAKVRFSFRPVMEVDSPYINNTKVSGWQLSADDKKILKREFKRLYETTRQSYYDFVLGLLEGKKRKFPCPFQDEGFVVNPDGKIFMCLFSDQGYLGDLAKSLPDIFGSPQYLKTSRNLINKVCATCSAECYTSRSSAFKNLDFLEQQLIRLFRGQVKEFEKGMSSAPRYMFNKLLRDIANFKLGQLKIERQPATDEEKIVFNTWLGFEKYKAGIKGRNGLILDFRQRDSGSLLLNLAKYYYFIKIYSRTQLYINIINKFFKPQEQLIFLAKELERKIKLL